MKAMPEKEKKRLEKAYRQVSEFAGVSLGDMDNYSFGVVVEHGKFFREVGIFHRRKGDVYYFRFSGEEFFGFQGEIEEVGFNSGDIWGEDPKIYWSRNPVLISLVRSKMSRSPSSLYGRVAIDSAMEEYFGTSRQAA